MNIDEPPNNDWIKQRVERSQRVRNLQKRLREAGSTPAPTPSQGEPGGTTNKNGGRDG